MDSPEMQQHIIITLVLIIIIITLVILIIISMQNSSQNSISQVVNVVKWSKKTIECNGRNEPDSVYPSMRLMNFGTVR